MIDGAVEGLERYILYITNVQTESSTPYPIPNCEVKRLWGDLVLWWVTTWETSTDVCNLFFYVFVEYDVKPGVFGIVK